VCSKDIETADQPIATHYGGPQKSYASTFKPWF
jgi:hypothetical protein